MYLCEFFSRIAKSLLSTLQSYKDSELYISYILRNAAFKNSIKLQTLSKKFAQMSLKSICRPQARNHQMFTLRHRYSNKCVMAKITESFALKPSNFLRSNYLGQFFQKGIVTWQTIAIPWVVQYENQNEKNLVRSYIRHCDGKIPFTGNYHLYVLSFREIAKAL